MSVEPQAKLLKFKNEATVAVLARMDFRLHGCKVEFSLFGSLDLMTLYGRGPDGQRAERKTYVRATCYAPGSAPQPVHDVAQRVNNGLFIGRGLNIAPSTPTVEILPVHAFKHLAQAPGLSTAGACYKDLVSRLHAFFKALEENIEPRKYYAYPITTTGPLFQSAIQDMMRHGH